ncbi:Cof-type HAD-IIB family hydrolase [Joostella sp. CR20]|uniref:Cof-type HAD-IIB family hydrolase n=1 Tax=Joostella sp. CR20 TaxID=2804312 RepID=UPI00313A978C
MYKIAFSDIDGTLLGPERELTTPTIEQVKNLNKKNIPFILVSSRMPKQMYHLQEDLEILETPLIAYNGAYVITKTEVVHSEEIPLNILEELIHLNENAGDNRVHLSLFNANNWYVDTMDYWAKREQTNTKTDPEVVPNTEVLKSWKKENKGAHKIMCMGEKEKIDTVYEFLDENFGDQLHLYRSKDTYIEIANKKVSKLTGIEKLLQHCYPSIKLEEAVAFGDNYNDEEMIGAVGLGVAVENARNEVKAVAKAITQHHKEDGVANYLKLIMEKL